MRDRLAPMVFDKRKGVGKSEYPMREGCEIWGHVLIFGRDSSLSSPAGQCARNIIDMPSFFGSLGQFVGVVFPD